MVHRRFGKSVTEANRPRIIDGEALFLEAPRVRRTAMSLGMRMLGAGLFGAAVSLGNAPVATAEPVWPVAGAESASATIDDLEAQGYDVRINWVSGVSSVPLSWCKVTAIHNPNHSPPSENTLETVYVDVSCPNPDDDWGWGGVGIGF
jgi:hypothetical protein